MANPTTYFGWVMPTTTDLVTDLPADFAVFGQGVDTSMQDLLGGTTGQVLSKTSGTNMDFTWINNDTGDITGVTAGTGITGGGTSGTVTVTNDMATTITTNGDLIYGTGSGTYTRRGIGSTSQVLTVVSGVPAWATPSSGVTWAAYTPSFSEMTLGNATYTARSATSGKLVYFYIRFTLGSTTTFSTYPGFTLPSQPSYRQAFYGVSKDSSASIDYAMYFDNNGTDSICYLGGLRRPTTYVETQFAANVPMTWAVGDLFYVTGAYEIA